MAGKIQKWLVPLERLTPLEKNARTHSERNISDIAKSLSAHGQVTPIVVDAENVIRKGNGTFLAARSLGWKTLFAVPYDAAHNAPKAKITEERLRAYQLQDNQTALTSGYDYETLAMDLKWLEEKGYDILALGWEKYELDPILNADFQIPKADPSIEGEHFRSPAVMATPIEVTEEQRAVFDRAWNKVKNDVSQEDMLEGRALELICAEYLS